jgi:hypothetical protein
MSVAVGQYKGWPRVVREMATHFLNSALAEISLTNEIISSYCHIELNVHHLIFDEVRIGIPSHSALVEIS